MKKLGPLEVLRSVEWSAQSEEEGHYNSSDMPSCCPSCGGLEPGSHESYGLDPEEATMEGHGVECPIWQVLADGLAEINPAPFRAAARLDYHKGGECEIDPDARVSLSRDLGDFGPINGAYVAANVYVSVESLTREEARELHAAEGAGVRIEDPGTVLVRP